MTRIGGLRLFEMARVLGVTISYLSGNGTAASKGAGPGDAMPAGGPVAHGTGISGASLAHGGQEEAELVHGYAAISDSFIRQRILQLLQSMAPEQP